MRRLAQLPIYYTVDPARQAGSSVPWAAVTQILVSSLPASCEPRIIQAIPIALVPITQALMQAHLSAAPSRLSRDSVSLGPMRFAHTRASNLLISFVSWPLPSRLVSGPQFSCRQLHPRMQCTITERSLVCLWMEVVSSPSMKCPVAATHYMASPTSRDQFLGE